MGNIFKDEFVPNIQGTDYYTKWTNANKNGDAPKWQAFRDAVCLYKKGDSVSVPSMATKYGRALVAAGKLQVSVTDIGADYGPSPTPPPTPPPASTYVVEDWSTGLFDYSPGPWATIFSYTSPGYLDCGYYGYPARTGTADGRVSIVANPYGSGNVMRSESRDTDPGWPVVTTLSKSEASMVRESTWFNGQFAQGAEIWITIEMYLPDSFSLASGGSNPFTEVCGLHPSSSSGVSALEIANQPGNYLQLHYGQYPGNDRFFNLIPLNNSSYRNRKIPIALGANIHPTSGWAEAWVDGVNVLARQTLPMCSATESGPYWKQGIYTSSDCSFTGGSINGNSIMYFGRTTLSQSRPF